MKYEIRFTVKNHDGSIKMWSRRGYSAQEAEAYNISALFQKEDVLTTFVTNTIRSTRFGAADPTGIANIVVYNYLLESKAIIWNPTTRLGRLLRLWEQRFSECKPMATSIPPVHGSPNTVSPVRKASQTRGCSKMQEFLWISASNMNNL